MGGYGAMGDFPQGPNPKLNNYNPNTNYKTPFNTNEQTNAFKFFAGRDNKKLDSGKGFRFKSGYKIAKNKY